MSVVHAERNAAALFEAQVALLDADLRPVAVDPAEDAYAAEHPWAVQCQMEDRLVVQFLREVKKWAEDRPKKVEDAKDASGPCDEAGGEAFTAAQLGEGHAAARGVFSVASDDFMKPGGALTPHGAQKVIGGLAHGASAAAGGETVKLPMTPSVKKALALAQGAARANGDGYVGVEHLLMGLAPLWVRRG